MPPLKEVGRNDTAPTNATKLYVQEQPLMQYIVFHSFNCLKVLGIFQRLECLHESAIKKDDATRTMKGCKELGNIRRTWLPRSLIQHFHLAFMVESQYYEQSIVIQC